MPESAQQGLEPALEPAPVSGDASALAAEPAPASGSVEPAQTPGPAQLVVFDFDGTSIEGNSPVLLVSHLMRHGMLKKRVLARIMLWAAAYKLRLPQNEALVRGLVFTAFCGKPVEEVNAFLASFYDERIAPIFRPEADAAMRAHTQAGDTVVVISATFEPIILRAMEHHPFANQISTRMCTAPDGTYTCEVEGKPVEGAEKLEAVRRFGDERFGPGNWELAHAYGDHHSDRAVLAAAKHAHAVDPDRPLSRTARKLHWEVLDW